MSQQLTLTLVTAYYKCYQERDNHEYVDHFLKIARKGFPIILFLDPVYASEPFVEKLTDLRNVRVITDVPFESLPVAQLYQPNLVIPHYVNTPKDTANFFILMNSKVDFLTRAFPFVDKANTLFAWIDFGIAKILRNVDAACEKLTEIAKNPQLIPFGKIVLPGCTQREQTVRMDYDHLITWRFCGGLLFGHRDTIQTFRDACFNHLTQLVPQISWEVNVWALVENNPQYTDMFQWYPADHNDSMFNVSSIA